MAFLSSRRNLRDACEKCWEGNSAKLKLLLFMLSITHMVGGRFALTPWGAEKDAQYWSFY